MYRTPPAYIELSIDDEDDRDTVVDVIPHVDPWANENTAELDFATSVLSGDAKLVVGYLTMEEHGIFGKLTVEEQQEVAATLRG